MEIFPSTARQPWKKGKIVVSFAACFGRTLQIIHCSFFGKPPKADARAVSSPCGRNTLDSLYFFPSNL
jgi:hypothetical protein